MPQPVFVFESYHLELVRIRNILCDYGHGYSKICSMLFARLFFRGWRRWLFCLLVMFDNGVEEKDVEGMNIDERPQFVSKDAMTSQEMDVIILSGSQ